MATAGDFGGACHWAQRSRPPGNHRVACSVITAAAARRADKIPTLHDGSPIEYGRQIPIPVRPPGT